MYCHAFVFGCNDVCFDSNGGDDGFSAGETGIPIQGQKQYSEIGLAFVSQNSIVGRIGEFVEAPHYTNGLEVSKGAYAIDERCKGSVLYDSGSAKPSDHKHYE
jgi:hypothetical protein